MLAIRMQRTGRSGHASFRVVVQDSRQSPTSGKFVALLGSYDPHTRATTLVKEKTTFYLEHGAQPSERVARLLKQEGIKLPEWAAVATKKTGKIRNPDKLRRNRPADAEPKVAAPETTTSEEEVAEHEVTSEEVVETPVEAAPEAEQTTEAVEEEPTSQTEESPPETEAQS
ncbi:MAG TPA: 30S ribosomal protein S16 [Patescibacteria group bacterium]|nr:30S ribosomal protein S16 [Patescibacteria group bacterium]